MILRKTSPTIKNAGPTVFLKEFKTERKVKVTAKDKVRKNPKIGLKAPEAEGSTAKTQQINKVQASTTGIIVIVVTTIIPR